MSDRSDFLLTLILPLKNEEKDFLTYLRNTLTTQKCKSFKIVVVDESDEQHFPEVITFVTALRNAGIHVDLVHSNVSQGVGPATLQGLLLSDTPFIFFLDADNIPRQDFACRIEEVLLSVKENDINNIAFVSFLSTLRFKTSLSNITLLNSRLYLSAFQKGVYYRKGAGFVNILRVWNKDFLLKYVGKYVIYPKLSYQDQPHFWEKIIEGLRKGFRTIHIDEVLVEDVRHLVEDFNVKFICRRMGWYTSALISEKSPYIRLPSRILANLAVLFSILPFVIILSSVIATYLFQHLQIIISILATLLLTYIGVFLMLCSLRKIPLLNANTFLAIVFMPLLLLIESACAVKILLDIAKKSLLR